MRIILCAVQIPFMRGGAESLCDNLFCELAKRGHEVEYIRIPFKWNPPQEIINSSIIWRLLDLSEAFDGKVDGVIATKFPSYLVKQPKKIVWLLHQYRNAYDLSNTTYDNLSSKGKIGELVRKKIHYMDKFSLEEARTVYTISKNVSDRLWRYNSVKSTVLYPPPPLMDRYYHEEYGDYIFYPSRLDLLKRQDLIIKSMKYIKSGLRLKIAGVGSQLDYYLKLAKELKIEDRIDFLGHVSDVDLLKLYANAFCVAYTPMDEDLGFVTMESFLSKKPVITCVDSGGPLEFVEDGINGFIASPSPEEIAKKINLLYDEGLAEKLGDNGYVKIKSMNFSWDYIIKALLEPMQ